MLLTLCSIALAHKPYMVDDQASSPETSFLVEDPDISIVTYATPTCEAPRVWLQLEALPEQSIFFQLGIPVADALEAWRPNIAIVAPGLPPADLGFPLPDGTGALAFAGAAEPETFYEPFSNTRSWILAEEEVVLPEGGPAWIVAYPPAAEAGRLWIAVGETEQFESSDWPRIMDLLDDVRAFHGTDGNEVPAPSECDLPASKEEKEENEETVGCATVPSPLGLAALGALAALRRRRHATGD